MDYLDRIQDSNKLGTTMDEPKGTITGKMRQFKLLLLVSQSRISPWWLQRAVKPCSNKYCSTAHDKGTYIAGVFVIIPLQRFAVVLY